MKCLIFVALAAIALPTPAHGQSVSAAFSSLQEKLGAAASAKPTQEQVLSRIAEDAIALQTVASRIDAEDRADFAKSIWFNAELLDEAARADDTQAAAILADVADDLEVKRSASTGMGVGSSFPGRVKVRVTTFRNGQRIPGYVVTLNPVRWRQAEPMYRLASLSPAAGEVPPGRYEVVARLGSSTGRDIFRIGLVAEDEINIELPVQ